MGNRSSASVNPKKGHKSSKHSSTSKFSNSSLKCEFDYDHNANNGPILRQEPPDLNDPRYWVPAQLSPSKILLLTSQSCQCPDAPPPSPPSHKTSNPSRSTTERENCSQGSRAIHNYDHPQIMTPFLFKRSRRRPRTGHTINQPQHHHQPAEYGENIAHSTNFSLASDDQVQRQPLAENMSVSNYTNTTSSIRTLMLSESQASRVKMMEGGDPLIAEDQHKDPSDSKIVGKTGGKKSNKKHKPPPPPESPAPPRQLLEVKMSAARTNLNYRRPNNKSSRSLLTESKASCASLKVKDTKLSFGTKLKNSLLKSRWKSRSGPKDSTNGVASSRTAVTGGKVQTLKDANVRALKSMGDVKPRSPEWDSDGKSQNVSDSTVIIHKLQPSALSQESHDERAPKFSPKGGPPSSDGSPRSVAYSPHASGGDDGTGRLKGTTSKGSSKPASPGYKSATGKNKSGTKMVYVSEGGGSDGYSSGSSSSPKKKPPPVKKVVKGKPTGKPTGKPARKRPPPPPVFIGSLGCGGCSSAVKKNQNPADRLKNVDIVEELVYNAPGGGCGGCDDACCCSCNPCCDYYSCCNDCGECQPVCQPCSYGSKSNPVKYCRRQRFNFDDGKHGACDDGPPFVWQGPRPCNPYDDIPVGKNPTCYDCSMDAELECGNEEVLPRESGTYFYDADRRCFAKVIEVKNPDCDQPEIVDEIIDEEPILTNIEPIIQPVIRATNPQCGGGQGPFGASPMPFVGNLGQNGKPQSPMSNLSPAQRSGKANRSDVGGSSSKGGKGGGGPNDYNHNLGFLGLCGLNMDGLTNMGPYGTIAMPQYQYEPPPMKPCPPAAPGGPTPPGRLNCQQAPCPPCQPPICGGPTCFPGYPSTNYPPYNPYFNGDDAGGDQNEGSKGGSSKKNKNRGSKSERKKKK